MNFKNAYVQYGDFRGEVAIDGHMGPFLFELAKIANIPTNYFPVAFSVRGETPISDSEEIYLTIAAVDKSIYGSSVDEIVENVRDGVIKAENFRVEMRLDEFFKLVKRINFTAINRALCQFQIECEDE